MFNRIIILLISFTFLTKTVNGQCLASPNPVGGTSNLLVLEKNTLRVISFFRHNFGNQYFEKHRHSDFDLIEKAYYNYIGEIIGYGINDNLTLETEIGYFVNKTQEYNVDPAYTLRGYGFSNIVFSTKFSIYKNNFRNFYYSSSLGLKIPLSTKYQEIDGVVLPIEVQSSIGAYGIVFQSFLVKENSGKALRYFLTNRTEYNFPNKYDFQLGSAIFTSFYVSKHHMATWLKGKWTTILQLRNEIRNKDKNAYSYKESTGSILFFVSPQFNYSINDEWNLSFTIDLPVYQYFIGTQLGSLYGITFNVYKELKFKNSRK